MEGYNIVIEQEIRWGDMDSFGHVNNILFFQYMESARMKYFVEIKFIDLMKTTGIGPILASTSCKFKAPLAYPDTVSVGAKVIKIEEFGFTMKFSLVSQKSNREVAEGEAVMISYDYKNKKKVPLPTELLQKIKELDF